MATIDFWTEIRNLKGRTLKTLDRRKPFQVVEVTEHTVIVLPLETGNEGPIPPVLCQFCGGPHNEKYCPKAKEMGF